MVTVAEYNALVAADMSEDTLQNGGENEDQAAAWADEFRLFGRCTRWQWEHARRYAAAMFPHQPQDPPALDESGGRAVSGAR